jgi:hypothetical protein
MLTICKNGPTTQTIGRMNYRFELDGAGRAVCEVGYEHLHVFLARSEVYALAHPIEEAQVPIVEPTPRAGDGAGVDEARDSATAARDNEQRRRRGRPKGTGKDDRIALAEMRQLSDNGMGLYNAAGQVAAKLAPGNASYHDSVRKRLLRKYRAGKSR